MPRVAYFGPQGTFTEQAARALAGPADELLATGTVFAAIDAVRSGTADAACVPVESSVEGSVPATMDALTEGDPVVAVAETVLPIRFSVLVRPGTKAAAIRTVASYPVALAQVRGWLAEQLPDAQVLPATSTAAGAVGVRDGEFDAAVTAPVAADHYPLDVLATGIADIPDAATRFLLVRRPGALPKPTGADRTALVAVTPNTPGALADLLVDLAHRGLNLTRIESRPIKGRLGEYRFFLDLDGHVAEPRVGDALAAARRRCLDLRFLGSFPKADGCPGSVEPGTTEADFVAAQDWLAGIRGGGYE